MSFSNSSLPSAGMGDQISPELLHIRALATRGLLVLIWAYVPAIALVASLVGNDRVMATVAALVAAVVATVMWRRDEVDAGTRYTVAAALAAQWMLMIYATSGAPDGLILDAHMMYFIINALLAAYFCWRTILVVNVIAAVHHTILAFLFPLLIWPSADNTFLHYFDHVLFVVLQTGPLLVFTWKLFNLFNASHVARRNAEAERDRAERLVGERTRIEEGAADDKRRVLRELADRFEGSVRGVMTEVTNGAERMNADARRLSENAALTNTQARTVLASAAETSANAATVADATQQLSASVGEITRRVGDSSRVADEAVREAARTNETVAGLTDTATKIGRVVELINSIASQTNLLALNATIEAARAGEAGKGFAVVAGEVKHLATQTAKATEEIQHEVSRMQTVTDGAVSAVRGIGETIDRMNHIIAAIAAAVEEQAAATSEISRSIQGAVTATEGMTGNMSAVTSSTTETGNLADGALRTAGELSRHAEHLRGEIDSFLRGVRAA